MRVSKFSVNRTGGRVLDDDSSRSNESGSVKSEFNCLFDQSFQAEDDSIAYSDSTGSGVQSSYNAEHRRNERESHVLKSGFDVFHTASREDVEMDDETQVSELSHDRCQVIIHTTPIYSEAMATDQSYYDASVEADQYDSANVEESYPEIGRDKELLNSEPVSQPRRRRVFPLAKLFAKPSRPHSSRPLQMGNLGKPASTGLSSRNRLPASQAEVSDHEVDSTIVDRQGYSSGPAGDPIMDISVTSESPGLSVGAEENSNPRGGLLPSRSAKACDDDGGTVSSKKSFGSRLSEGSKRSLVSLRSRLSFRRRREPRDDLDGTSIDSTSIVSHTDNKRKLFKVFKAEQVEEADPFWFSVGDSCYFFQCMCEPAQATSKISAAPKTKKRRYFFFPKQ